MRRALATAAVAFGALAAPAAAEHHLMKVNEVFPSPGDPNARFVELLDPVSEPFMLGPFGLEAFDAANVSLASQEIAEPVPFANSTAPFVYGGPAVSVPHATLTMALPPGTSRVCFMNTMGPVNCLNLAGLALQPGQSAQRQSPCGVAVAAPTPNAPNAPCGAGGSNPGSPGGAGGSNPGTPGTPGGMSGGGGQPGGTTTGDTVAPTALIRGKARQDIDKLTIRVEVSEDATLTVSGRVSVLRPRAAASFRLKTVRRQVQAGQRVTVRLKLSRRGRIAAKAAIRRGQRVRARIKMSARDGAGNTVTKRRSVRLTD
jgi:hypothetical protein